MDNDRGDLTCYAESDDGINWVKPNLGIFTFDGSPDNNIIWDLHGASVFIDREEPNSDKRYKAIGFCRRYRNIFLITSPDGIRWDDKDNIEPVALRENEGTFNVIWDPHSRIFRRIRLFGSMTVTSAGLSVILKVLLSKGLEGLAAHAGAHPLGR